MKRLWILTIALALPGCVVATVVDTTVSVAGSVAETAVDVTTGVVGAGVGLILDDDED